MSSTLVILGFVAIAAMRVIQKICSKKVSGAVSGATFFHYGGYYNLISALLSLISVAAVGFVGFDAPTLLCAALTAAFMALELLVSMRVLKTCTLILVQMFSVGSMFIPCLVGIFLFDEPMRLWQWLGLCLFMGAMYLMICPAREKNDAQSARLSPVTVVLLVLLLLLGGGVMVAQKAFSRLVVGGSATTYSFLMFAFSAVFMYLSYLVLLLRDRRRKAEEKTAPPVPPAEPRPLPRLLLVCGLLLAVAVFVINLTVTVLGTSVPSALLFSVSNVITIVITLLVGYYYYRERITLLNALGILLSAGAIAMITFL